MDKWVRRHAKPNYLKASSNSEPKPQPKPIISMANSSNLMQEDETASWFQYTFHDPLEKELCSEFLYEMPMADTVGDVNKLNNEVKKEEEKNPFTMPPPKSHTTQSGNFSHLSRPMRGDMAESSSIRTVGSSACGSNQVQNQGDVSHNLSRGLLEKRAKDGGSMISLQGVCANTFDTTVTSSSGGSGCSFGRTIEQQSMSDKNNKRKGRDGEESECHSEEAGYESIEAKKQTRRPTSTRKSRAAEAHNLSERRRRDRINEKMRELQELIPHCNKSDKASMLDEAIEYLKSLQLQLQLMWMGSGMAPMMFSSIQQYMPRVNVGMGHASIPSIDNPIQLSRIPLVNHFIPSSAPPSNQMPMCLTPTLNANNLIQNVHQLPESYARYFGFPHMQLPPQAVNLYSYGSHMVQQQNQTTAVDGSSSLPTSSIPVENLQNGHSG